MNIKKINIGELRNMQNKGFNELIPYTHKNPLVRWIFWKRLETLISLAPKGQKVLDFGAGSGVLEPTLVKNFKEVYALDRYTSSLEYLKNEKKIKNLKIIKYSCGPLPFKDNFFDVVFAADVLEHFHERKTILKEFKRVLKYNGKLLISGPTENFIYKICRRIVFWFWQKKRDHFTNIEEIIKETSLFFIKEDIKILPSRIIAGFKICKFVKR
jgi:ubiquinone/menaquinone biosynthesis C-methylase UbiE